MENSVTSHLIAVYLLSSPPFQSNTWSPVLLAGKVFALIKGGTFIRIPLQNLFDTSDTHIEYQKRRVISRRVNDQRRRHCLLWENRIDRTSNTGCRERMKTVAPISSNNGVVSELTGYYTLFKDDVDIANIERKDDSDPYHSIARFTFVARVQRRLFFAWFDSRDLILCKNYGKSA